MISRSLRTDFFWSGAELAMRYGMQFVTLIVLARFVSPREFGFMAIAMIVIAIGNVVSDSGMTVALTRLPNAQLGHFATVKRFGVLAGMVCVAISAVVAWPLARSFDAPAVGWLLIASSLSLPAVGAATAADAYLIRHRRFAERAQVQAMASASSAVIAMSLAVAGGGAWALVAQLVTAATIRMFLLGRLGPSGGHASRAALADLLPLSGYLLTSGLLDAVANRGQAALLGKLFGAVELGFYSQAQNIQQVPTTTFSAIVNKVGLPQFTAADTEGRLHVTARAFLRGTYLAFCPLMFLAALLSTSLVPAVLGERWAPVAPILAVLCAAAALWPVHVVNLLVCTARGDGRAFFRLEVLKKITLIAMVVSFGWRGPLHMATAVGFASLAGAAINASYSAWAIDYRLLQQGCDLLPPTLASALAATVSWVFTHSLGIHGLTAGMLMAVTFAIIYALPGVIMGKRALADWRRIALIRITSGITPASSRR